MEHSHCAEARNGWGIKERMYFGFIGCFRTIFSDHDFLSIVHQPLQSKGNKQPGTICWIKCTEIVENFTRKIKELVSRCSLSLVETSATEFTFDLTFETISFFVISARNLCVFRCKSLNMNNANTMDNWIRLNTLNICGLDFMDF